MLSVSVRWTPSHLLDKPSKGVYTGISNLDILGNGRADILANEAAASAQVPNSASSEYLEKVNLIKKI